MNNYPRIFLIILGLITSFSAFSTGGDVSGGGNIVVCNEGTPAESYELLDYFEARYTLRGFELDDLTSYSGSDVYEKAISIFEKRLKKQSPYILDELTKVVHDFRDFDVKFLDRSIIVDINDNDTPVNPGSNCFKRQIAVQFKNPSSYLYRVLIDKTMWDKIDEETKIGLILHEAIYKIALDQGHLNSNKVRYLNAALSNIHYQKTQLSEHFVYAGIESCWNLFLTVVDEDESERLISFPVYVSTLNKIKESYTTKLFKGGITCKKVKKDNVFMASDDLFINKDMKITLSTYEKKTIIRIFQTKENYPSRTPLVYKVPFNKEIPRSKDNRITYYGFLEMQTSFPFHVYTTRRLTSSNDHFITFPYLPDHMVDFQGCSSYYFVTNNEGHTCLDAKGYAHLFGNELKIKAVSPNNIYTETEVSFHNQIKIPKYDLNYFLNSAVFFKESGFYLVYDGLHKTIQVSESLRVEVQRFDSLYFDLNSQLIDIKRDGISILK